MLPTNEVLVVAAVAVGVLLIVGGTMLARKPAPAQTSAPEGANASNAVALANATTTAEKPASPWWVEILGPEANPTPEEQNEILARLKLLNTDWSNNIISRR